MTEEVTEEVLDRYKLFLLSQGYATNIVWVEAHDVLSTGQSFLYVKLPVPEANCVRARENFDLGKRDGYRIKLGTICELPNTTFVYLRIFTKESEILQSPGVMMSALAHPSRRTAVVVKNSLRWRLLRLRFWRFRKLSEQLFN